MQAEIAYDKFQPNPPLAAQAQAAQGQGIGPLACAQDQARCGRHEAVTAVGLLPLEGPVRERGRWQEMPKAHQLGNVSAGTSDIARAWRVRCAGERSGSRSGMSRR